MLDGVQQGTSCFIMKSPCSGILCCGRVLSEMRQENSSLLCKVSLPCNLPCSKRTNKSVCLDLLVNEKAVENERARVERHERRQGLKTDSKKARSSKRALFPAGCANAVRVTPLCRVQDAIAISKEMFASCSTRQRTGGGAGRPGS